MAAAGVPVLPSVTVEDDGEHDAAAQVGFPLLVKAAFGGGGRGMRLVSDPSQLAGAVGAARREAAAAFGDGTVFLERYVPDPRHVEVQILGDAHGDVVHLFERECSIQRRYQKIVEESPSPAVDGELRAALTKAAVTAGPGGRLHRRGHRRVRPGPRRVVLLPGDEHPAAGRAPGHRGGHRPGPGRAPAAHRRGRAAAPRGPRGRDHRPRHRGPPVRRGRPGRVPAGHRHAAPLRDPVRTRPAGGHRVPRRVGGEPALRRDAGQGHRARPHPRRRRPPAGPGPPEQRRSTA